jgi:hypothetical protein
MGKENHPSQPKRVTAFTLADSEGKIFGHGNYNSGIVFRYAHLDDTQNIQMTDDEEAADINATTFERVIAVHLDGNVTSVLYERQA